MDNAEKRGAVSSSMDALRLAARLEHRTLDELEAGFADRVGAVADGASFSWALFLTRGQLLGGDDVAVGARVHVEVLTSGGEAGLVVEGVVAWSIPADRAPPGRESGVGVAVLSVDDDTAARLRRMAARPGAGSRVRLPGQRLAQRLRLGEATPLLLTTSTTPTTAPTMKAAELPADPVATQPFATLFQGAPESEADGFLHASTVELPAPPRPRLMGLLADRALGDSEPNGAVTDSRPSWAKNSSSTDLKAELRAALADDDDDDDDDVDDTLRPSPPTQTLPTSLAPPTTSSSSMTPPELSADAPAAGGFLEAPTLDGPDDASAPTSPPTQESSSSSTTPPASSSSSSSSSSLAPPPGLESLPDAPDVGSPFDAASDGAAARPFESQSTDIDLLSSISANDIISLDLAAQQASQSQHAQPPMAEPPQTTPAAETPWQGVDDLPSADADLVAGDGSDVGSGEDWELRTDHSRDEPADWPSLELGETMVLELRPLPAAEPWPVWSDLTDARTIGMFCSYSRRGQGNVEMFAWPLSGTKRYSRVDPVSEAAGDVFSSGAPFEEGGDDLFGPSLEIGSHDDPFAPAATDPRLNVEGVVAKNVRDAFADGVDGDVDVFSTSNEGEATRDEMPMPHLVVAAAASDVSSEIGSDAPWSDAVAPAAPVRPAMLPAADLTTDAGDIETDRDLRRPK